jgi:hypothetical protein
MTTDEIITQEWSMGRTVQCIERNLLVVYGRSVSRSEIWKVVGKYALEQSRKRNAEQLSKLVENENTRICLTGSNRR